MEELTELHIRYDEDEQEYYVYFEDAWGNCLFQSDAFDTIDEAEAYRQDQIDNADFGDDEDEDGEDE